MSARKNTTMGYQTTMKDPGGKDIRNHVKKSGWGPKKDIP